LKKLHKQIKFSHKFITSFIKGLKAKIQELPKTIIWLQLFFSTGLETRSYAALEKRSYARHLSGLQL